SRFDLLSTSRPILRGLRDALGHTVVISKVEAGKVFGVERADGFGLITFKIVIGAPLNLHASAQGKLVLAFGPESAMRNLFKRELEAVTPQTIVDPIRLRKEVDQVRRQGWAAAPGETLTGLNALAMPIFDDRGELVATLAFL